MSLDEAVPLQGVDPAERRRHGDLRCEAHRRNGELPALAIGSEEFEEDVPGWLGEKRGLEEQAATGPGPDQFAARVSASARREGVGELGLLLYR